MYRKVKYKGYTVYYEDDIIHREGGPAVIGTDRQSGFEAWIQNNQFHRLDGPAVIYSSYENKEYWEYGKYVGTDSGHAHIENYHDYFSKQKIISEEILDLLLPDELFEVD